MITVRFLEESYTCAVALRGDNYVHLLDENGIVTAAFDGVVDFGCFEIEGDWTFADDPDECPVAVVYPDGRVAPGGHKCGDITPADHYTITLPASADSRWVNTGSTYEITVALDCKNTDLFALQPENENDWAYQYLNFVAYDGNFVISTTQLPTTDCVLHLFHIRVRSGAVAL